MHKEYDISNFTRKVKEIRNNQRGRWNSWRCEHFIPHDNKRNSYCFLTGVKIFMHNCCNSHCRHNNKVTVPELSYLAEFLNPFDFLRSVIATWWLCDAATTLAPHSARSWIYVWNTTSMLRCSWNIKQHNWYMRLYFMVTLLWVLKNVASNSSGAQT